METYTILGTAIPQGSKSVSKQGYLFDSNKNLRAWRKHCTETMQEQKQHETFTGPIHARIVIRLPKPKSVKREHPSVKPDIDKLARAILDSATDAGIWKDDGQVVQLRVTKRYTEYASSVVMNIWELNDED